MEVQRGVAAIGLGAATGLTVGAIELGSVLAQAGGYFDGAGELVRFAGIALGLPLLAGAIVGLCAAPLVALLSGVVRTGRAAGFCAAALAAAPTAWLCAQIFRGPQAQRIPGHTLYAIAIGLGALAVVQLGARGYVALLGRIAAGRSRLAMALVLGMLLLAIGAHGLDLRVLPRLYPFFHLGLRAITCGLTALALLAAVVALGRARPRLGEWLGRSGLQLAVLALALAAGVGARAGLDRARGLRTLALERTSELGGLIRLSQALQPAPSVASPVPAAPADPARAEAMAPAAPLAGPHLGAVDVFLVTIDAMRADQLTPEVAPALSALADHGVRFTRAYTQVPHTSFSVATLLTGKHVYSLSALGLDASRHETLAAVLRRERWKTAAFYPPSAFFIDRERLQAFRASNYDFEYVKLEYLPADQRVDQILRYFEAARPERAFVWAHFLEPHEPYEPHPGVTRGDALFERYQGEIRFVDAQVARLLAWVKQHRRRALFVIAADHGEEFGEHGGHYHGTTLYEEQVRVPLAFALVGADEEALAPRRVDEPVGLVDVAPSILGLLGIERSLKMSGQDLGPAMLPEANGVRLRPQVAEIDRKKMLVRGHDKLICDLEASECQLYDLAADPREARDVSGDEARLRPLKAELDAFLAAEARFERSASAQSAEERLLDRARQGDRTVAAELGPLLAGSDRALAQKAAALALELPPEPRLRPALEEAARAAARSGDRALAAWADLGLARLGDEAARARAAALLSSACAAGPGSDARLCARGALATVDVPRLAEVLSRLDDHGLELAIIRALGAATSHKAEARDALQIELADVRTRKDVLLALAALGEPGVVPTLARWVPHEPYVDFRAQMVRTLHALAPTDPTVRATLRALRAQEREPAVRLALDEALRADAGRADPGRTASASQPR